MCKIEHSIIGEKELAVSEFSYFLQENHMGAWSMINDSAIAHLPHLVTFKGTSCRGTKYGVCEKDSSRDPITTSKKS